MSANVSQPLEKLVTLLTHARRGAFAIALYDRLSVRREMTAALRQRLSQPVYEVHLSEQERNPIDLIRALKPKMGDVVCLFDLERAFPEALGYLDLQREVLTDMDISVICWVTAFEHRELAYRAPNFYAFRTAVFDFATVEVLPPAERRFVGRKREERELTKLLKAGGCVVLTGLGGVGKTALAQEVAREMRSHFVGGTVWMNCETRLPLGDILLTAAVALIGGMARQFRSDEQRQRLDDALRDRPCLLVIDNFETIAEDGEVLRWLKTISAPSAALIVSRQSVPYLSTPTLILIELPSKDAVELFTQRARDAGWEGADAKVVPRLCKLVGNLPLAIELLARRAAELPLTVLAEMVSKSLDALAAEKDLLRAERQQSIVASIRVSFDRLTEDARNLLMRLSVLPDGAGESVIAPFTGIKEWHQPIAECVRHSLLNFEGQRYRFHPLVRRFALAQLGDAAPEWQRRFVAFFRQLVVDNHNINDLAKLAVLDAEWRNALAAAEAAEELKDWSVVVALSRHLSDFLHLRGMWSEGVRLHQRALAAARASGDRQAEGGAFNNLGNVYRSQGRWAEAEECYQQSLAIRRELGDRVNEGETLKNFAELRAAQDDLTGALELGRQAVAALETTEGKAELERARELVAKWERQAEEWERRKAGVKDRKANQGTKEGQNR